MIMDNSIYRLRPINEYTLDELNNHYLWFSKPSAFNDVEDANIALFIEKNKIVYDALSQIYNTEQIEELSNKMRHIGICCFTTDIPSSYEKEKFPKGHKSIVVEYNKHILADYFKNSKYVIPNCFKSVVYTDDPIMIETDDQYHYLYLSDENGSTYKSIKELKLHHRYEDNFIFFLLTRINTRFEIQKEQRIILSGHNIKEFIDDVKGYSIEIPLESIMNIHYYPGVNKRFLDSIKELGYDVKLINN